MPTRFVHSNIIKYLDERNPRQDFSFWIQQRLFFISGRGRAATASLSTVTRFLNAVVAAAWLAAAVALVWMAMLLAGPPENSIVDTAVMIAATGGALACILTALREIKKPVSSRSASVATHAGSTVRAASSVDASTRALTNTQHESVMATIGALITAGLVALDSDETQVMRWAVANEWRGDVPIGTVEALDSLHGLIQEDYKIATRLVFTVEQVEQYPDSISTLVQQLLQVWATRLMPRMHWYQRKQLGSCTPGISMRPWYLPC